MEQKSDFLVNKPSSGVMKVLNVNR